MHSTGVLALSLSLIAERGRPPVPYQNLPPEFADKPKSKSAIADKTQSPGADNENCSRRRRISYEYDMTDDVMALLMKMVKKVDRDIALSGQSQLPDLVINHVTVAGVRSSLRLKSIADEKAKVVPG